MDFITKSQFNRDSVFYRQLVSVVKWIIYRTADYPENEIIVLKLITIAFIDRYTIYSAWSIYKYYLITMYNKNFYH